MGVTSGEGKNLHNMHFVFATRPQALENVIESRPVAANRAGSHVK